jgi:surfeit locus 1 family protein
MNIFTIGQYTFAPKIKWMLLTIIVASLLCYLGFWQLHRAEQKNELINHHQHMQHVAPIQITAENLLMIKHDQPLQIKGVYDAEHTFFIDNQFYNHQIGYEIIQPVILSDSQQVILVSRGWVKAPLDRKILPPIQTPKGEQTLHGVAYFPSKGMLLLGDNVDNATAKEWPKRIEKLHLRAIRNWLSQPVYPFIIRLHSDKPDGFVQDWPVVVVSPERHIGYAVQWFAMALTVVIIFIVLSVKKKHVKKH